MQRRQSGACPLMSCGRKSTIYPGPSLRAGNSPGPKRMTTAVFIDTNIILYSVTTSEIPEEIEKKWIARNLLERKNFGLSVQVLQEFWVNATGKFKEPLPRDMAIETIAFLEQYPIIDNTPELFHEALRIQERFQLSFWDANIFAAALKLKVHTLYSEDLNHEQNYEGVRVINPFIP